MATFVRVPRNEAVLDRFGPYPELLDVGGTATAVQRRVRDHGLSHFEPATQATLLALVQSRDTRPVQFFDVGAHVGLYSALISTIFPADVVRATAFEPTPRTARIGRAIAAANRLPVRIERRAVASEDGVAQLHISPWETSNSLRAGFRPAKDSISVPTVSLDSYCAARNVWPDVIKIDVETFEAYVLLGARATVRRARPAIVCELLGEADRDSAEQALAVLEDSGYHLHRWLDGEGWLPCEARDIVERVRHDGRDWLFTPDELSPTFHRSVEQWLDAIGDCTAAGTRRLDRDQLNSPRPRYQPRTDRSTLAPHDRVRSALTRLRSGRGAARAAS